MGLSFVAGHDKEGAALYLLHDGSGPQERSMVDMKQRLEKLGLSHQIQVFSVREEDGEQIRDFYDIQTMPSILLVRDNDELAYHWSGQMPAAETISYHARQVSA